MQRSPEGPPDPYVTAECLDCDWRGFPEELESGSWEDFRYCPECQSDNTNLMDNVFNMQTCDWEIIDEN